LGGAVGVAVEEEEVLTIDDPAETESAEPAEFDARCSS
jgi:hypothetical protein